MPTVASQLSRCRSTLSNVVRLNPSRTAVKSSVASDLRLSSSSMKLLQGPTCCYIRSSAFGSFMFCLFCFASFLFRMAGATLGSNVARLIAPRDELRENEFCVLSGTLSTSGFRGALETLRVLLSFLLILRLVFSLRCLSSSSRFFKSM